MLQKIQHNTKYHPTFNANLCVYNNAKLNKNDLIQLSEITDKIGSGKDVVIISRDSVFANIDDHQITQNFPDKHQTQNENCEFIKHFLDTLQPAKANNIKHAKNAILEDNIHPEKVLLAMKSLKTYVKDPKEIITDYDKTTQLDNKFIYPQKKFPEYSSSARRIIDNILRAENNNSNKVIKKELKTIPNLIKISNDNFYYGYNIEEDSKNFNGLPYDSWIRYNFLDKSITLVEKDRRIELTPESNYKRAKITCHRDKTDNSICYTEHLKNNENLVTKLYLSKNHKIDSFVQTLVNDFGITKFKIYKNPNSNDIIIKTLNHNHICTDIKIPKNEFFNIENKE